MRPAISQLAGLRDQGSTNQIEPLNVALAASTIAGAARAAGFQLQPYAMSPDDVPSAMRVKASARTLERIHHFASAAGWPDLGRSMLEAGFVAEQEALERI